MKKAELYKEEKVELSCSRCHSKIIRTDEKSEYKYWGGVFCEKCGVWIKAEIKEGRLPR